jgi:23S rRNA-/tRNA-specific pseudouridylate synthase
LIIMWQWRITEFEGGRLLAEALALRIPAAPRAYLHQLVRKGRVYGNGQPLTDGMTVAGGMHLALPASARLSELFAAGGIPPSALLHEDQAALVVFKPAGMAVHQAVGHDDNLTSRVARFMALRHAPYRAAPVHRLDVGTSGPVLFGKGREATGQYGRLLMAGQISKGYLTLVSGQVPGEGELTTPVPEGAVLKPALTRFRRLATTGPLCLLELDLVTGRSHQARRQLADAGWPIIGDRRYGGRNWPGLSHPFLHSHRLCFPLLATQQLHRIDSPLPTALLAILAAAGLKLPAGLAVGTENPADFRE